MSKLHALAGVVAAQKPAVVELLESLLADARAGKIQTIALAYETDEQGTTSHAFAWEKDASITILVGEIERMKLRLIRRMTTDDGQPADE